MKPPRSIVADNLARVGEQIARAAAACGRTAEEIRLVAVTKYVDADTTAELFAAGCCDLGESRPQELWDKASDPRLSGAAWHLVGRLQTNKAARTLPVTALIHSVDTVSLVDALERRAAQLQLRPAVLLEFNCSGERAKQGFSPQEAPRLAERLAELVNLQVQGLMTMAPRDGGAFAARHAFAALRQLRDSLNELLPTDKRLVELSMGMSGDFPAAIAEGATIVRIGSRLFEGLP